MVSTSTPFLTALSSALSQAYSSVTQNNFLPMSTPPSTSTPALTVPPSALCHGPYSSVSQNLPMFTPPLTSTPALTISPPALTVPPSGLPHVPCQSIPPNLPAHVYPSLNFSYRSHCTSALFPKSFAHLLPQHPLSCHNQSTFQPCPLLLH